MDHLPLRDAVAELRLPDVVDSYQLTCLIETLDELLVTASPLTLPVDLHALFDDWIDAHLETQHDEGILDAAELRYRARLFASIAAGFEHEVRTVCERVWYWRRCGRVRPLPAQWIGVI